MPAGLSPAYDRIVALCGSAVLTNLAGSTGMSEAPYRLDLADQPDTAPTRRFHVVVDAHEPFEREEGSFSGTTLDSYLRLAVQVSYYEGGGDTVTTADRQGVDRLALDDLDRLRQHLTDPDNYATATSNIVNASWTGTTRLAPTPGTRRRVYALALRLWIRHDVTS